MEPATTTGQVASAASAADETNNNTTGAEQRLIKVADDDNVQVVQVEMPVQQFSPPPNVSNSSPGDGHTVIECGPNADESPERAPLAGDAVQVDDDSQRSFSVVESQSTVATAASATTNNLETSKSKSELEEEAKQSEQEILSARGEEGRGANKGVINKLEEANFSSESQQTLVATNNQQANNKSISAKLPPPIIKPICISPNNNNDLQQQPRPYCKRRRLSYLQSLLLRKWPCLALAICIMSSLIFGMLLSALTVYLMHGVTDCSAALAHLSSARLNSGGSPSAPAIEPRSRLSDFDTPLELASLETSSSGRLYAALSAPPAVAVPTSADQQQVSAKQALGQQAQKPRFQRLPTTLWPQHYDLFVQPYIAEPFNFSGKVSWVSREREREGEIMKCSEKLIIMGARMDRLQSGYFAQSQRTR